MQLFHDAGYDILKTSDEEVYDDKSYASVSFLIRPLTSDDGVIADKSLITEK